MNAMGPAQPTTEDLAALAKRRPGDVVSLLMPPLPVPEARLTLRNLAKAADRKLEARGHKPAAARTLLAPVDVILDQHEWWTGPTASLAIYLESGGPFVAPGPPHGPSRTVVGSQFHILHLLAAPPARRYAVLVLGKKSAHLYRGAGRGLQEVRMGGLPVLMEEVLRFDDRERQLQSHSSARQGANRVVAAFHGQGGRADQSEDELRYLRVVVAAVDAALHDEPLVLAATEENVAAFRRVSDYSRVVDQSIAGSGEHLAPHELAELATPIVADLEREEVDQQVRAAADAASIGDASLGLEGIIGAAFDGRVASLVLAEGTLVPGSYDAAERDVRLDDDGEDLINLAAIETARHGGTVLVVPAAQAPMGRPATALLRY
jgi:hypothetical protein